MKLQLEKHSWILLLAGWLSVPIAQADELRIAVASNFAPVLEQLAADFKKSSGHTVVLSAGATGKLYTQITSGAPFDVFFAADNDKPALLVSEHKAVAGTAYTYALGQLVLWSTTLNLGSNAQATLKAANFRHLAIASPKLAPYGAAAQQTLEKLQLWEPLQAKLVMGENIAQTLQFIESGNAELGFIALAQWLELPAQQRGTPWQVPAELHAPITQDAVILKDSAAARAFLSFMQSAASKAQIKKAGYALP
jgi:molybdate transport system substrate-binding protein